MMRALERRAQTIARRAERRRLAQIAVAIRARGFVAEVASNGVIGRGRNLVRTWLSDPLLRFVGRMGS
jgi:hypothetical protein